MRPASSSSGLAEFSKRRQSRSVSRAVIYVRNSSGKQVASGTDVGQLDGAQATAKRLGATVVAIYADRGISAKSGNLSARGDFARLIADLPSLKPDLCIVANVDRLTRTEQFAELGEIWGPLQTNNVKIATSGGQILDLSTPEGQLLAMFESWRSSRENATRRERTKAGRARAAKDGRNPGQKPYGYQCVKSAWSLLPSANIVRECYDRIAAGEASTAISADLNQRGVKPPRGKRWNGGKVRDLVNARRPNGDPYVTGLWIGQRGEAAIKVPAIVDEGVALRARAAVSSRHRRPPPSTKFVQFIDEHACRCGLCGGWIRVAQSRGRLKKDGTRTRFAYYACEGRLRASEYGEPPCALPLRRVEEIDDQVWRKVEAWAANAGSLDEIADEDASGQTLAERDLDKAQRELAADQARLAVLADALGSGAVTAEQYRVQAERLRSRRDLLARQVETWQAAAKAPRRAGQAATAALRMAIRKASVEADPSARRELIRQFWPEWTFDGKRLRSGGGFSEPKAYPERIVPALRIVVKK